MDTYHSSIHQNLVLLCKIFPNLDMETKLQKNMFKKPNTKGMQSVFYSLMGIVDHEYVKKFVPWPISYPSDNYKFKTAVIDFIRKECPNFEEPKLLPSLLNKAEGEKFVRFVFDFITYITKMILQTKFGQIVLEKQETVVEENIELLDAIVNDSLKNETRKSDSHKRLVDDGKILFDSGTAELETKLKGYHNQRQILYEELKEALSYTNVTEETVMESVIKSREDEVFELQRQCKDLEEDLFAKLNEIEHLINLVRLKQKMNTKIVDVDQLRNCIDENFSQLVQIPLLVILSTLFVNERSKQEIDLRAFLQYGRIILINHLRRFNKFDFGDQHLNICKTVDDISSNTENRLIKLIKMIHQLDEFINGSRTIISRLETQRCPIVDRSNDTIVEFLLTLRTRTYQYPRLTVPDDQPPLFIFSENKDARFDPQDRIRKRLALTRK